MRDIILVLVVLASIPLILRKPFFGVLVWIWLGLMNPHRLCWGFATELPFSQIIAVILLISFLISKESKRIHWNGLLVLLALWWVWMLIAALGADFGNPWSEWGRIWKIMLLTFVMIILTNSRERLNAIVIIAVLSIGFYAVKGGIFTILTGGSYRVWGPARSFIGGNNEVGLAMIMTLPLMRYLQLSATRKSVKRIWILAMSLTFVAILGTQSRGAFVGVAVMFLYLILKSRNRVGLALLLVLLIPAALWMMPESWYARMNTIETYQQDASAMSRINVWHTAWNATLDHPITGCGFNMWTRDLFNKYAPDPSSVHDVHSIYFEVLGETGFVGLGIFLLIGVTALLTLRRVGVYAAAEQRLTWMRDLSSMVFVSLMGYAASGAFLGLAYFDYYYLMVAITVTLQRLMTTYRSEGIPESAGDGSDRDAVSGVVPWERRASGPKPGGRLTWASDLASWYRKL
jgi:probable O-glycosylation ligase (exosortase A-associated)